jgi:hypothetical protein
MTLRQQALSDKHKESVKAWVPKVRKVLEQDLAAQLERLGIRRDGKHTSRVEALLNRETLSEGDPKALKPFCASLPTRS